MNKKIAKAYIIINAQKNKNKQKSLGENLHEIFLKFDKWTKNEYNKHCPIKNRR